MMKRTRIKEGDVFEISLGTKKGYFQFLTYDLTQLNSAVIKVFKEKYDVDYKTNINDVLSGGLGFYAHVDLKYGIKIKIWSKIGNCKILENINEIFFRDSDDYGNPEVEISNNWYIWRINEDTKFVGVLNDVQKKYDIGVIVRPQDIVTKMKTGFYDFSYPSYE